jgi:hypothetical protein
LPHNQFARRTNQPCGAAPAWRQSQRGYAEHFLDCRDSRGGFGHSVGSQRPQTKRIGLLPDLLDLGRGERLYGSLGRVQEQALRSAMMAAPWDAREAYEWRLRRQQDIVQTMRQLTQSQANTEQARAALRSLLLACSMPFHLAPGKLPSM